MAQRYQLPSGRLTTDEKEYLEAWRELGEFFARRFQMHLIGFDPDILLSGRGPNGSFSMGITINQSLHLRKALETP